MTCNNCIHQTACFDWCRGFGQEAELCEHYSDKSEWFHLIGKDCETAYYALGYGDDARVINVTDNMDWTPPTPEQIKNLKEMLNIDVILMGDKDEKDS